MADILLKQTCSACKGTGIRTYNVSPGGPLAEENPCSECGGDGKAIAPLSIDPEWFDDIAEKIDYIKTRVKKIWLKVKDEGDEE